jgi:uncharacterized membrane protein YphA (DoxX/SURF4 family)
LTTSAGGGGRASAIGGTFGNIALASRFGAGQLIVLLSSVLIVLGAMTARGLSTRPAAVAAVAVAVLIGVLSWWFFRVNLVAPIRVGYGFYIAAVCAVGGLVCSIWALMDRGVSSGLSGARSGGDRSARR